MKRFSSIFLTFFIVFFFISCNKDNLTLDEAKILFKEKLNTCSYASYDRINSLGKYGDSYAFYSYGEEYISIDGYYKNVLIFGNYRFEVSNKVTVYLYNNGDLYLLTDAYNNGLILYEDVLDIEEKFKTVNGGEIEKDFELIDNNPKLRRCKHEFKRWKTVIQSTCTTKGIEESKCSKCKNITRQITTNKKAHSISNGICIDCNYVESTLLAEDNSIKNNILPNDCITNFILGLNVKHKLYGESDFYIYELIENITPKFISIVPILDRFLFIPDNINLVVVKNGQMFMYNDVKHLLNDEDYMLIYQKYIENNLADKYISKNINSINLKEIGILGKENFENLNRNLNAYFDKLEYMNNDVIKEFSSFITIYEEGKYIQKESLSSFNIYNYFGEYSDVHVFYNEDFFKVVDDLSNVSETINDLQFNYQVIYSNMKNIVKNILVYNGKEVVSLKYAYEHNWLSDEDISKIHSKFYKM